MKAIVIGSGIAGIASALRLRSKGYEVDIYEGNSFPGGKIAELTLGDFRFDMGPSLFTLPNLVDELFDLFPNHRSGFRYTRLKNICNYFWEDGHRLRAHADRVQFNKNVNQEFGDGGEQVLEYLKESKQLYELTAPTFVEKSLHKASTWLSADIFKPLLSIGKFHLFNTLNETNSSRFQDPHLRQLFNRYATYNGSSPFLTPGLMQVIPHLEYNLGAYFPSNGMRSVIDSLVDLSNEVGINFHFNQKVKRIIICNGIAKGIELDKKVVRSDVVVSNSDIHFTQSALLQPKYKRPVKTKRSPSSSAYIFYWGMNRKFDQLDIHNVFFSENYQTEFEAIFNKKELSTDPTIYIHVSSKINQQDAPEGFENWFVMINAPASSQSENQDVISDIRKAIIDKIERMLNESISKNIIEEHLLTPTDIERRTGAYQGALYGPNSNTRFSAFLRYPNFTGNVKNLFHCGGSVHPGGGIPLCLNSAKIVASLIPDSYG
ncbi:MAG: phytoene dehydrogenase [Crocinitomicaceae bacterium]|nr:phytoene dehydrogenase [Crocinitomicaceae bacterium]|tara:strand:- start:2299 stop:3765 length:1467 start_codon:yes stop_codon:yes gene_type:complete